MFSIAILIPLTSKDKKWNNIFDSFFYKYTFASIFKCHKNGIKLKFYLGIDKDEKMYTEVNFEKIFDSLTSEQKKYVTYDLTIFDIEKGYLTKMWNVLAKKAQDTKYHDYYLQISDDIIINDIDFLEKCISTMIKNNNFGVTGPTSLTRNKNEPNISLTQSFVSNKHFKIFGQLFLEDIKNWHCDTWIDNIYLPKYNYRIKDSTIKNNDGKSRYSQQSVSGVIKKFIARDKLKIDTYINRNPGILKKKPILIIGNGKSASQIDWVWLCKNKDKIDTFGINSAYKMYEKLKFYPTYYANLDSVVIKSHSDKLQALLNKQKINKCFYLDNVKFNENDTYYRLHKVRPGWKGLSKSNLDFHSWANTGSDCVQLAIMLGYREIYIIGVDGYVEKIKESSVTQRKTLTIRETPKDNPNYWFNEYQEKGDEYNVPNASIWHKPGWDYSSMMCKKLNVNYSNLSTTKGYVKSIPFVDYKFFKLYVDKL